MRIDGETADFSRAADGEPSADIEIVGVFADIPDDRPAEVWEAIMRRIRDVPAYRGLFTAAYPGQRFEDMTIAHASNAIAAFFVARLSFTDTPWDRFLRGDDRALDSAQLRGARNFLAFTCVKCHSGPALSDNGFHSSGPGPATVPTGATTSVAWA